jgi:hypothetical protein
LEDIHGERHRRFSTAPAHLARQKEH